MMLLALVLGMPPLLQEKDAVRMVAGAPVENTWPLSGQVNRPEDTVLQILALRLERRWDAKIGRFRECASPESRVWGRAQVSRGRFQANLPSAPPGYYRLSVCEEGKELHAERLLLGGTAELAATWGLPAQTLDPCRIRIVALLELAIKVSDKEIAPTPGRKKDFLLAIAKEDGILEAAALKSDFTAVPFILRGVLWHLRNAQIWGRGDSDEGKFLDSAVTFSSLEGALAGAKSVLWTEFKVSVASVLAELAGGDGEASPRRLSGLRRAATQARKALERAGEIDPELAGLLSASADVDDKSLPELRAALKKALENLLERP